MRFDLAGIAIAWSRPLTSRAVLLIALEVVGAVQSARAEDLGIKGGTYLPDPDGRQEIQDE